MNKTRTMLSAWVVGAILLSLCLMASPVIASHQRTIFVVHGINQGPADMFPLSRTLRDPIFGVDLDRFKIDYGYDWRECADRTLCDADRCTIQAGARKLAQYINGRAPSGDIIIIGYSLGGLIARDMIVNNYFNVIGRHNIQSLITLGTPNVGYPFCFVDLAGACETLLKQMASNFRSRQDEGLIEVSAFLGNLLRRWRSVEFRNPPDRWLTIAGTFCRDKTRDFLCFDQGCPDFDPRSDGVVCFQSAKAEANVRNQPSDFLALAQYAHSKGFLGLLPLCTFNEELLLLPNPPASGLLIDVLVRFIETGDAVQYESKKEARQVLSMNEDEIEHFVARALRARLPAERMDDLYLLALDRPNVVVKRLYTALVDALAKEPRLNKYTYKIADVLAYSGDESALAMLKSLSERDERFQYFVERWSQYQVGRVRKRD